ncbi:MAG: hypothetical protein R2854_29125 [Caldilineaceae bacterium]
MRLGFDSFTRFNNHPYVDDKTRQTVLEAAEALGYPRTVWCKSTGALRTVLLLVRLQQQGSGSNGDRNGSIENWPAGVERAIAVGARSIFDEKGITTRVEHTLMNPAQTLSPRPRSERDRADPGRGNG